MQGRLELCYQQVILITWDLNKGRSDPPIQMNFFWPDEDEVDEYFEHGCIGCSTGYCLSCALDGSHTVGITK